MNKVEYEVTMNDSWTPPDCHKIRSKWLTIREGVYIFHDDTDKCNQNIIVFSAPIGAIWAVKKVPRLPL